MSESHDVLDFMREQFARVNTKLDNLAAGLMDVSRRVTPLEGQVALLHGDFANRSIRLDRIVQRLDLVDQPLG